MRQYVILNATEAKVSISMTYLKRLPKRYVGTIQTKRYKTFVKYEGTTPAWLGENPTVKQMLTILNNPDGEWYSDPDGFNDIYASYGASTLIKTLKKDKETDV